MIITRTKLGVDLVGWPTVCTSDFGILIQSVIFGYVYLAHMVTNSLPNSKSLI